MLKINTKTWCRNYNEKLMLIINAQKNTKINTSKFYYEFILKINTNIHTEKLY